MELLEVACLIASLCKLVHNLVYGYSLLRHHYKKMIDKIGDLENRFFIIAVLCCNDSLAAFLAYLFQDLVKSLFKKVTGV